MTDKELLELAAKAAGIENLQWESDGTIQNRINRPTVPYSVHGMISAIDWNPLTDDGDAFRLAVNIGFGVSIPLLSKRTDVVTFYGPVISITECHGDDPCASTRRAIVRAAAEIGKGMK